MRRICLALAVLFALPAAAQDPGKKPAFGTFKRQIGAYFASAGPQRAKKLEELKKTLEGVALAKPDWQWLETAAIAGNPTLVGQGRKGEYTIELDTAGKKHACHVHVAGGYKPNVPAPVVVALHGGSEETTTYEGCKKAARDELGYWSGPADSIKAFTVAPSTTGFWSDKMGLESIFKAIDHVRGNFNIDPNRIAVVGHSMGGFGIFDFAPDHADRFALAAPFVGGADATSKLKNCRNLPFYIVVGLKDPMQYIVEGCRKNAKFLQDLGYDVTFKERADQGHDVIADEFPAVMQKLVKSPRNLYAKRLTRVTGSGRWYWIEAQGAIEAEIKENTITITGPSSAIVYLSDRMVDLDKPVKILLGDEVKFEGKVERSAAFCLEHLEESGDAGRIFANRVEIKQ